MQVIEEDYEDVDEPNVSGLRDYYESLASRKPAPM